MSASVNEVPVLLRAEADVAADAIWALFDAGLLPKKADTIVAAANAAGIPLANLKAAAERRDRGWWKPPDVTRPRLAPVADPPEHHPERAPHQPNTRPATAARIATKNPAPGMRTCSRCWETRPVVDFAIKNRATGTRKSMCRVCMKEYQRQRYLSIDDTAHLGTVLRFIVEHGDLCEGEPCPDCGKRLIVGQEVAAFDVAIRHLNCLDAARAGTDA